MKPTIAERVHRYLSSGLHTGVCDNCLANVIDVYPTQITNVTTAFAATVEFTRERDWCDKCGKKRKVTRRNYGANLRG